MNGVQVPNIEVVGNCFSYASSYLYLKVKVGLNAEDILVELVRDNL